MRVFSGHGPLEIRTRHDLGNSREIGTNEMSEKRNFPSEIHSIVRANPAHDRGRKTGRRTRHVVAVDICVDIYRGNLAVLLL